MQMEQIGAKWMGKGGKEKGVGTMPKNGVNLYPGLKVL